MPKPRSYKMLCPIARGLDVISDRWTLLILRDLHAGPARFTDLQKGLTGIAANLLTDRLAKLIHDGLAMKSDGAHGAVLYRLTDEGHRTRNILFELALFGGTQPVPQDRVKPGNLRTVATTLGAAAARTDTRDYDLVAEICVDGEVMTLTLNDGAAGTTYGAAMDPDVVFDTGYEALLQVSEGEIELADFAENYSRIKTHTPGKDREFMAVMQQILAQFRSP